jgi:hypothetical protein
MPPKAAKGPFTFRVRRIPGDWDQERLESAFLPEYAPSVTVRSLASDPGPVHGGKAYKVATVLFDAPETGDLHLKDTLKDKGTGLQVDSTFIGLTLLNEAEADARVDVVAVTGLAGHAFGSWACSRYEMWLRDYLPEDIGNRARVFLYGYDSKLQGTEAPTNILDDYAKTLMGRLRLLHRSAEGQKRTLVLIGHSLGGLIIKQVLALEPLVAPQAPRLHVAAVIFIGVPHRGMEQRALENAVHGEPSHLLVKELGPDSSTLRYLTQFFPLYAHGISIYTFYENRLTATVTKVSVLHYLGAATKLTLCRLPTEDWRGVAAPL